MVERLARAIKGRTDEEIAMAAQKGDQDAESYLSLKYHSLVREIARGYYLVGGERKDLEQEGHIGLLKAIRTYSPDSAAAFGSFAYLCIDRKIISAVRAANRQKHRPLSSYLTLSEEGQGEDVASVSLPDPEETLLRQEKKRFIEECAAERLSPLEKAVLTLRLEGKSYQEIAHELHSTTKAVDNAVQRIRKKLKDLSE